MDAIRVLTKILSLVLTVLLSWTPFYKENAEQVEIDRVKQIEYISELEEKYNNGEAEKCNEQDFFLGDLEAALKNQVKYNELSFIATHNSYQKESVDSIKRAYDVISSLTFGLIFGEDAGRINSRKITEQLNSGIRSLEIDLESVYTDGVYSFNCFHSPMFDMTTNCYDFALTLKEIRMWSDYNPDHLPVTIIIEPKEVFAPMENMEFFSLSAAEALDVQLREILGDKLFTPADMLGEYENFGDMRKADGWADVSSMLGKVVVLLHENPVTEDYIALDENIKTQAMFPMLREDDMERDCASFLILNDTDKFADEIPQALEKGFVIRVRADLDGRKDSQKAADALTVGAQIISTDYPYYSAEEYGYFVSFDENKTVKIVNK